MFAAIVLVAIVASALLPERRFGLKLPVRLQKSLEHPAALPLALLVLLTAQHAYLALVVDASYHQVPDLRLLRQMPVRIINDVGGPHIPGSYGDRFACLALIESLTLGVIYCALAKARPWKLALVAIAVVVGGGEALGARAGSSADMYSYIGFTILGKAAYTPPHSPFSGAFEVINAWWGTPIVPAPYGPFWLAVAAHATNFAPTLFAKIFVFRSFGLFTLFSVVAVLAALRVPARIVALIALNPFLTFQFVANVHNDLFATALLLGARLACRRGALLPTIALAVLAALVKLPFLIFAALVFVPIRRLDKRIVSYLATVILALSLSLIYGGSAYFIAILHHVDEHTASGGIASLTGPDVVLKLAAVAGVAVAFLTATWLEGFAWALPAVAAAFFPWYFACSLTYAVASSAMLRNVAIVLPIVGFVTDTALCSGTVFFVLEVALLSGLLFLCSLLLLRRWRTAAESG